MNRFSRYHLDKKCRLVLCAILLIDVCQLHIAQDVACMPSACIPHHSLTTKPYTNLT